MFHVFLEPKPWFAEKRFGYGAGLPIAWQGWALLLLYTAAMIGLAALAERASGMALAGVIVLMMLFTAALVVVAKARTRREWRWRWGADA